MACHGCTEQEKEWVGKTTKRAEEEPQFTCTGRQITTTCHAGKEADRQGGIHPDRKAVREGNEEGESERKRESYRDIARMTAGIAAQAVAALVSVAES